MKTSAPGLRLTGPCELHLDSHMNKTAGTLSAGCEASWFSGGESLDEQNAKKRRISGDGSKLNLFCSSFLSAQTGSNSIGGEQSDTFMVESENQQAQVPANHFPSCLSSTFNPGFASSLNTSPTVDSNNIFGRIDLSQTRTDSAKAWININSLDSCDGTKAKFAPPALQSTNKKLIRAHTSCLGGRKRSLARLKRRDGGQSSCFGSESDVADRVDKELLKEITKKLKRSRTADAASSGWGKGFEPLSAEPQVDSDAIVSVKPCGDNVLVRVKLGGREVNI